MGSAGRVKGKWIFRGDESSREPLGPAGSGAYFPRGAAFQREWLNLEVIKTPWLMETHWGAKEFMSTSPSPRTLLIFYFSTYECIWLPPPVNNLGESVNQPKNGQEQTTVGKRNGRPRCFHKPPNHTPNSLLPGALHEVWGSPLVKLHSTDVQSGWKTLIAHPLHIPFFFFLYHYPGKKKIPFKK